MILSLNITIRGLLVGIVSDQCMAMLVLGFLLLVLAIVLDFVFRFRMTRIGHPRSLLKGGDFDYAEYHKVRREHGWAAWPVYLMWAMLTCGIALFVGGFLTHFDIHPKR
jgi:ABC-type uncharacterized transport system permease subunit